MPYERRRELPRQVRDNVPKHGQDIFRKAYNSAYEEYGADESRASRVAWAAVKHKYKKGEDGHWHRTNS